MDLVVPSVRRIPISGRFVLAAVAGVLAAGTAQAREFRATDIHERNYPTVQTIAYMGGLIFDRTGGELGIEIVLPGAQGSEKYALQQLRNGTIDMARVNLSAFEHILPSAVI